MIIFFIFEQNNNGRWQLRFTIGPCLSNAISVVSRKVLTTGVVSLLATSCSAGCMESMVTSSISREMSKRSVSTTSSSWFTSINTVHVSAKGNNHRQTERERKKDTERARERQIRLWAMMGSPLLSYATAFFRHQTHTQTHAHTHRDQDV